MYVYRKRSAIKKDLAKEKVKQALKNKTCPACSGILELVDKGTDRQTFVCTKCHSTLSFADIQTPVENKGKETRLNSFTLRDKSAERKKPHDYKNRVQADNKDISAAIVAAIRDAMSKSKMLQFDYRNDKQVRARMVEPYKLAFDGSKNMILYAYCTEGEGIRIFKLTKMENVTASGYDYKPRWDIEDKLGDEGDKK